MNFATLSLTLNTSLNTTYDNMNLIYSAEHKLYLGNIRAANDKANLHNHQIGAVLSVIDTSQINLEPEIIKMWIAAEDEENFQLIKYFDAAVKFIQLNLKSTNVLVHCYAGISRSATLVIAFLIKQQQLSLTQAIQAVKKQRFFIEPNRGFLKQLEEYQARVTNHSTATSLTHVINTKEETKRDSISYPPKRMSYLPDKENSLTKPAALKQQEVSKATVQQNAKSFFESSDIQDVISNYRKQNSIEYQWYRQLNRTEPNEFASVVEKSQPEDTLRSDCGSFICQQKPETNTKVQISFLNSFSKTKKNTKI